MLYSITLNVRLEDPVARIRECTGDEGADICVEIEVAGDDDIVVKTILRP